MALVLGYNITVVLLLGFCIAEFTDGGNDTHFFQDHLTPYSATSRGSRRISREIADCQHVRWENRTFEELLVPRPSEVISVKAQVSTFCSICMKTYIFIFCSLSLFIRSLGGPAPGPTD